ncbi:type IV pili methyl-accepting chemotaxis transducer N-terminal domain-containing protein [Aquimarina sp. U1-2]|uniref:sensor histidine kinase n=1 Tax=Aquimarina sp. U1-2 TaxID=2823141 RepID=UPI001AECBF0F|nr:ATP-binding protein [Aquimarina sp. U1-2]MBP2833612.1 type IV pili methyl-accepting chemotaxis transducer N-terminal domain-containing protein [Aquimarina sp. U1-2]
MKKKESLDHQTFSRLSRIYSVALGAIALFTIGAQFFIQQYLNSQIDSSRIINVSGRQRMLSQKITKEILLLSHAFKNNTDYDESIQELKGSIELWRASHNTLLKYNKLNQKTRVDSTVIQKMFEKLEPYFQSIYKHSQHIIQLDSLGIIDSLQLKTHLKAIIQNEPLFLKQMDAIVFQYDKEAQQKISQLKKIEYLLFTLIIIIIILEIFFLFRPVTISIRNTISDLLHAQQRAEHIAFKAEKLRKLQEENVQELVSLNRAIDQTLLYARVDEFGNIKNFGKRFAKLLGSEKAYIQKNITDILGLDEVEKNRLLRLITQNKGDICNEEFKAIIQNQTVTWLDISILTVFKESGSAERLILCTDITTRKEAQNEVERLRTQRFKEKEKLQKLNASQIVEAQEEERKRIAKEIHDSIGQMLTALKLNIESINLKNAEKAFRKIESLKQLSNDLIQGIRFATFNLTPPELKDYGIRTALQKMVTELSKLTGKNIVFESKLDQEQRFDTLVETNLYRVTQEAVNNAIKYADSTSILVSIYQTKTVLSISIDDNGKGFDIQDIPSKPAHNAEGGMGLFFMKERMNYINGRLFMNSTPGKGTRITLNYELPKTEILN